MADDWVKVIVGHLPAMEHVKPVEIDAVLRAIAAVCDGAASATRSVALALAIAHYLREAADEAPQMEDMAPGDVRAIAIAVMFSRFRDNVDAMLQVMEGTGIGAGAGETRQ